MSGYNVNVSQEAVDALINMGNQLADDEAEIKLAVANLKRVFEENQQGLGAHTAQILELIEEVEAIGEEGDKLVLKLVLKLKRAAGVRQQHINNTFSLGHGRSR